jgi:protein O-mannosyl-transferase
LAPVTILSSLPNARGGLRSVLCILLATVVAYATALNNGFVWDDIPIILQNQNLLNSPFSLLGGIDTCSSTDLTPYYRPFTYFSFLLDERLHGFTPWAMHLVNLALHAGVALLSYKLAQKHLPGTGSPLLVGLLVAVHPIHGEAVNFLSGGRNTLLSSLFVLAAWLWHEQSARSTRFPSALLGAVSFMAALLAKETALALLPFIIALEWSHLRSQTPIIQHRAVMRLAPYVAGVAVYWILRSNALASAGVAIEVFPGLGSRLLANLYIIPRYLLSIIWPLALSSKYPTPADLGTLVAPLLAAWLAIAAILGWTLSRGRSRASLFGLAWFTMFWLPVSGIIPFPSAPMADRYLYLPAIGLWLVGVDQASRLLSKAPLSQRIISLTVIFSLAALAIFSMLRTRIWQNDLTLFSHYAEQYPTEAFGHHNLGTAYLDQRNDLDQAEQAFLRALALNPTFPKLRTQLGYVYLKRGDYSGAQKHYSLAIAQNPLDAEALYNRAYSYENSGRYAEAIEDYRRFLAIRQTELASARPIAEERIRDLSLLLRQLNTPKAP